MIKRVIIVSSAAYINVEKGQLLLETSEGSTGRVPCEDIGVLLLEHAQITITRAALTQCIKSNAIVLLCDDRHMPIVVLQPFYGNTLHAKVLRQQIGVSDAIKRQVWKQIVQSKIRGQLRVIGTDVHGRSRLKVLVREVKSGDKTNVEAQAAKLYWRLLFGDSFRRSTDGDGINTLLNYGYAVLRALTARSITMSGLHPALGIHHSNQYNPYALADDLIEPLRPFVDQSVRRLIDENSPGFMPILSPDTKKRLLDISAIGCSIGERTLPLMVAMQVYLASFKRVLFRQEKRLEIPEI